MKQRIQIVNSSKKKRNTPKFSKSILIFKLIIAGFLLFSLYYFNSSYTNSINLLAVSENSNGDIKSGSLVKLTLKVKPGSGQTFVNLNTIEEIDTQISIINSQKIACDLFSLKCSKYDFYYNFEGSALLLKGPSASSAIALLTAKTINKETIPQDIAITGSLNSGGLIGNVGGVDKKIEVAIANNYKKVLVPVFSTFNETKYTDIEVIKVLDLIEVYNEFGGNFKLKEKEVDTTNYEVLMKNLASQICENGYGLKEQINFSNLNENSSDYGFKLQANKSMNSSAIALENENYYSQGSFCFNANINYRILLERQKNLTVDEINKNLNGLKKELDLKYVIISSDEYQQKIKTINDFYVYLLMTDRLSEAREFVKSAIEIDQNSKAGFEIINKSSNNTQIEVKLNPANKIEKENLYSYAKERYFTTLLWEELILNIGTPFEFSNTNIDEACVKLTREISIKSQLVNSYGLNIFNEQINKQTQLSIDPKDKYLCVYKGLELNGRLNAVLSSTAIKQEEQEIYTKKIVDFANTRLAIHSNGDFPLIPYIYAEYAQDLFEQKDFGSSMLYSSYAISYADLNLYLDMQKDPIPIVNQIIEKLINNPIFVGAILLVLILMN